MPSSGGSSQPGNQTQVSYIAGRFFTGWDMREAHEANSGGGGLVPKSCQLLRPRGLSPELEVYAVP